MDISRFDAALNNCDSFGKSQRGVYLSGVFLFPYTVTYSDVTSKWKREKPEKRRYMYSLLTVKSSYHRADLRSDGPYSSFTLFTLIMTKYVSSFKREHERKNNRFGNTCYILPKMDKCHVRKGKYATHSATTRVQSDNNRVRSRRKRKEAPG